MPKRARSGSVSAANKKKALVPVKYIQRPMASKSPELKAVDTASSTGVDVFGSTDFDQSAPVVFLLNGIAAGTDFYQRIGRKVKLRSLLFRGDIYASDNATTGALSYRVALVYDSQTNGAAVSYSDIFQSVQFNGTTGARAYSGVNLNNRDRFKVLKDWTFTLAAVSLTVAGNGGYHNKRSLKAYIPLNHDQIFSGTGGTLSDIQTGALFLIAICDANSTGDDAGTITWNTRVRFSDD